MVYAVLAVFGGRLALESRGRRFMVIPWVSEVILNGLKASMLSGLLSIA